MKRGIRHTQSHKLKDGADETIKGASYEPEIQLVVKTDDVFIVERVVKTKRRGGRVEYFVKWRGYLDFYDVRLMPKVSTIYFRPTW